MTILFNYTKEQLLQFIQELKIKVETPLKQAGVDYTLLLFISYNLLEKINGHNHVYEPQLICGMAVSVDWNVDIIDIKVIQHG